MREILQKYFKIMDIPLTDNQINQFIEYYNLLIEWNEKFNLTNITEKTEVVIKHFLDSVLCYKAIKVGSTLIDVGTGAGFPAIPLKILLPTLKITLVDSLNKRIVFLQEVVSKLNLTNVSCIHSRAEDYAKLKRETFDYCVARAVARLNTLSEYCLPLVKIDGKFIALKGEDGDNELNEAKQAIKLLGGKYVSTTDYDLPEETGKRKIIIISKISKSPNKYPRDKNKPKLQPLN